MNSVPVVIGLTSHTDHVEIISCFRRAKLKEHAHFFISDEEKQILSAIRGIDKQLLILSPFWGNYEVPRNIARLARQDKRTLTIASMDRLTGLAKDPFEVHITLGRGQYLCDKLLPFVKNFITLVRGIEL